MNNKLLTALSALAAAIILAACGQNREEGTSTSLASRGGLNVIAGSEMKNLEASIKGVASVGLTYRGSVDTMYSLQSGELNTDQGPADALLVPNPFWVEMGNREHKLKISSGESIMRAPVVFGVKHKKAQELGWIGREVSMQDILTVAESGKLRFMMTSATQSGSGACAYIGMLSAFSGAHGVLTEADLAKPNVQASVKRILGTVNRTAGSSGFLKDLFVKSSEDYDGMFNYEPLIIQANQELIAKGASPDDLLYVVYPKNGVAVADVTLFAVDRGNAEKTKVFESLKAGLQSEAFLKQAQQSGWRTGQIGLKLDHPDTAVFNPDWGIKTNVSFTTVKLPNTDVMLKALDMYQGAFRKPSFSVYCLDFSGSMEGNGREQLVSAMREVLLQDVARRHLLQASPHDVTAVIIFNNQIVKSVVLEGNKPKEFEKVYQTVQSQEASGGTNMYAPIARGLTMLAKKGSAEKYTLSINVFTDGQSNEGSIQEVRSALRQTGLKVPIYSITFGDADPSQLNDLAKLTGGKVFDGTKELGRAFREMRGYN